MDQLHEPVDGEGCMEVKAGPNLAADVQFLENEISALVSG